MPRPKTKPYPPVFIRRVLDDVANHNVVVSDIADLCVMPVSGMNEWFRYTRVRRGSPLTDEQLDACVRKCLTRGQAEMEEKGLVDVMKRPPNDFRELTKIQKDYAENGYNATKPIRNQLGEREMIAFAGVLSCVDRQIKALEMQSQASESIEEVTRHLIAGMGLKQLREIYLNPPPITSWKDVSGIVAMTREALDMNKKSEGPVQRVGVDINVLGVKPINAKPTPPPIDATIVDEKLED